MACACINKVFDLTVMAVGATKMVVYDDSIWAEGPEFEDIETMSVSVRSLTSRGIAATIPLTVKGKTVVDAATLGIGKPGDCIRDGLYCFEVSSCGRKYSINRAWLPNAGCAVDALVANAVDDNTYGIAAEVKRLVDVIEAQTRLGRIEEARSTYKVLSNKLKGIICDCCN